MAAPASPARDGVENSQALAAAVERRTCPGSVAGATGRFRYRITAIPAISCKTAKRKARLYDRTGRQPAGWTCTLAREQSAPRLFSCAVRVDNKLRGDAVFALEVKHKRPAGQRCKSFTVGVDTFFNVRVRDVSCRAAKRLLDQATLSANRRNRRMWPYADFRWTFTAKTETSALITGRRGSRLIRAGLAKR